MSQSIGIKSQADGSAFFYIEDASGDSLAFGSDNMANTFVLNTSHLPNVIPNYLTSNIQFDPSVNGDITFMPNGSGGINALGVASVVVSNKNYVTINTVTGELGSDNAPLASISITGDTGGALTGSSFTFTGGTTGLLFNGSGTTETLTVGNFNLPATANDASAGVITSGGDRVIAFPDLLNVYIGKGTGGVGTFPNPMNVLYNVAIGAEGTLNAMLGFCTNNIAIGREVLNKLAGSVDSSLTGVNNIALGAVSLSELTSGNSNIAIGSGSLASLLTGSDNICIAGGGSYASNESNNICIATGGVVGDNNIIRIGDPFPGSVDETYIAGIASVVVSNKNYVTIDTTTGQLGSDNAPLSSISITGDSGGALTGSAFTFTGGSTGLSFAGAGTTETLGGTLVVSNGGTGDASFTAYSVICGGTTSTGALQNVSGVGSSGQVLTSNGASALPTWQTNSSFAWSVITANQTAVVNNGYICNKAGTLALALPATAAIGDTLQVTGINTAAGWQITQAANQQIFFGTSSTTLGATGTLTSTAIRDSVSMVCVVAGASTVWNVISSVGSPTIA